ncbi:NAD-dependent epimerase/dehydratase family protein [Seongchinamella sediminis]|uniref:NAD-dependent epimerase/dehydratase family protein n=1 Tax=Seongchinamella sediminis TaxID=2283635 RepID=A0A3L7DXI3_9GAMM|nr:NAD(P)-dependent oxidoreductase [Seongchinamella sediminis]RLQ22287.1 NAD-dependent epimerase/dehydratase family protein [Seongchinamella sediminis]
MLHNQKILVTGATGQVARPIAEALVGNNEVWAAARFSDPQAKVELEARGIKTAAFAMGDADLAHLPAVDYVIHCGCNTDPKTADAGMRNAEGTGFLMQRYREVKAFFHMSSSSIYRDNPDPQAVIAEDAVLGGFSHYSRHYAMSKLATEAVVRFQALSLNLPTIIARLDVAYGEHGHGGVPMVLVDFMKNGWPYQRKAGSESYCSPIYQDDIIDQVQGLLAHAAVPAPVVNLGGDEPVSVEQMAAYIEDITGLSLTVTEGDHALWQMKILDNEKRRALAGPCRYGWKAGIRAALAKRFPDIQLRA